MRTWCLRQSVPGIVMTLLLIVSLSAAGFDRALAATSTAEKTDTGKRESAPNDVQRLEGKWVRPDGGYVLELRNIKKDGSVAAAYYNPRPIKVYKSEVSKKNGKLNVFIELRDLNYPGSTYTLVYDPASDRLLGKYFQAVEKQTFYIEFLRVK